MKKIATTITLFIFCILISSPLAFPQAVGDSGFNSCGYEMIIIPIDSPPNGSVLTQPTILDAWTTDDPYGDPFKEVYQFSANQDTLAFVVQYYHTGGRIPQQFARAWRCNTEEKAKDCRFNWTVDAEEGIYLLINYFERVPFKTGKYDWAVKVGALVFGWPNQDMTRPLCFEINPPPTR